MPSKYDWSEEKIARFQNEGRGLGTGGSYRPWLTVHDLSSRGLSRRASSRTCGRVHHLFSQVEHDFFLMLDWSAEVVDIREQFPLDRSLTRATAAALGLRHPRYPRTKIDCVMTVDFLVDVRVKDSIVIRAYDTKVSEELNDRSSIAKLEITRAALASSDIEHHLVIDTKLPTRAIENLKSIGLAQENSATDDYFSDDMEASLSRFYSSLRSTHPSTSLRQLCADDDLQYGNEPGTAIRLAKILMIRRSIAAPLTIKSMLDCPIAAFV
ncbi:TnsA endonuclease N-terminal domain-containing protein [Achromobacter marplatensis]|uniref:TnsA endonuclease N-terminal domain-containing protein n=1 Tax=Achromobacter marplatensis TaxID=470868 RepID=UPI0028E819D0|nr:TnsA endonuclease N-terminal domain-containing protein [Achromobacter marplatensis]